MVNALDFRSNGPGSRPGWGCVVFLGKTIYSLSHCLSSLRCIIGYQRFTAGEGGGNTAMD